MNTENTQIGPGPDLAGAAGSAGCAWIISPPGWPYRECGLQPTHRDPETGDTFCSHHADDYADVFGWESLHGIDAESPNARRSATPEDAR